ncbi:MAG TPA: sulfatase, partial [bacterium]|nr:sulfatase [bacterium]
MAPHRGAAAAAIAVAAAISIAACAPDSGDDTSRSAPAPSPGASSLLLVSLDTFRADAAGSGGDPQARTPHLDRLARTGVQFEDGLVPVPLTRPSHASMLTGVNPPKHGIRDNGMFGLAEGVPTLAEHLRERGFATAAFIAAFPLDSEFGLDRGFDVYDDVVYRSGAMFTEAQRDGDEVTRSAAEWIEALPSDRRAFVWVHLFDAHSPPNAPAPVSAAYGGDAYPADVWTADHWLGRAVRTAEERGGFRIIVLGDHGESRGEHREPTHGVFVYGSTMRVPAVVHPAPAGAPAGLQRAVFRAIDVPATAFDLLELAPETAPGDGVSALTGSPRATYMESLFPAIEFGWAELRAVQADGWKYVRAPESELYDLRSDPGETRNVIDEHPERAAELAAQLDSLIREEVSGESVELDAAAREALESLGYVTGDGAAPDSGADLPDPKRMIAVQNDISAAQGLLSEDRPDAALQLLRRALRRDPRNKGLYLTMGMALARLGAHAGAADAFVRSIELPPHRNDRVARFELASSYLLLGENEKAAEQLKLVLETSPNDAN